MGVTTLELEAATNGFILKYRDPEIERGNRGDGCWQDPWKSVVFNKAEELVSVIAALLPAMSVEDEAEARTNSFNEAFDEALKGVSHG